MDDLREYFAERGRLTGEHFVVTSEQFGETFYGVYGPELSTRGWSTFPQDRNGKRAPARVEGERIKWGAFQDVAPSPDLIAKWALHASTANVAAIMGPASANAIAIDIDITDERLSVSVQSVVTRILGPTEFMRIGNAPKIMMFYRLADPASFNKRMMRLLDKNREKPSDHIVEILARNSAVTIYGRHHSTGSRFQWCGEHASAHSPMDLPVITEQQLEELDAELDKVFGLQKPSSDYALDVSELTMTGGPKIVVSPRGGAGWVEDPKTGLITDGREKFLTKLCFELIRANPSRNYTDEDYQDLIGIAFSVFNDRAERGNWGDGKVRRMAAQRLRRNGCQMMQGEMTPNFSLIRRNGALTSQPQALRIDPTVFDRDPASGLSWITTGKSFRPKHDRLMVETVSPQNLLARQAERKLIEDRRDISPTVARKLDQTADRIFRDIIEHKRARTAEEGEAKTKRKERIITLKAQMGSGKTSRVMQRLLRRLRERPLTLRGKEHIIFIVRTHEMAAQLAEVARADGAEILTHMSDVPVGPADPARPRVAVWSGKYRTFVRPVAGEGPCAKCPHAKSMKDMEKADISPGVVCGEGKRRCQLWLDRRCTYYRQPEIFETARIIIAVVNYLTMPGVPGALEKDAVALIVDEDASLTILRHYKLAIADLKHQREGTTTRALNEAGFTDAVTVQQMRLKAVDIVLKAMAEGKDAAAELRAYAGARNGRTETGEHLLMAARAVVEQVRSAEADIEPNMTPAAVSAALAKLGPKWDGITAERHLWRVIRDRMKSLADGTAKGQIDMRLQRLGSAVRDEADRITGATYTHIRISRRIETRFRDIPAALLDASAQRPVLDKLFGREVVEVDVPAQLHLRVAVCLDEVFSDASLIPRSDDDLEASRRKEARIFKIRAMITKTCAEYAPRRILFVATQGALDAVLFGWRAPDNLDWRHFGDLRGFDGAKNHSAIITVGRSQMPVDVVDAKAAALGYDDEDPEAPLDALGTGFDAEGKAVRRTQTQRVLRMRNGHNVLHMVPELPGVRGRQVERAWREEELRQAVGRLRRVHRDGSEPPALWIALGGSAIDDSFIVDEIFSLDDIFDRDRTAELQRLFGELTSNEPKLKQAADREASGVDHAGLESRINQARNQNPDANIFELRAIAVADRLLEWRREAWSYLDWLPAAAWALITQPERLGEIGLDADELDDAAFEAWDKATADLVDEPTEEESDDQADMRSIDISAPATVEASISGEIPDVVPPAFFLGAARNRISGSRPSSSAMYSSRSSPK